MITKITKSKKYSNVYYHTLKGDKKYFFRYSKDGKYYRKIVGLESNGITEKFCYEQFLSNLVEKKEKRKNFTFNEIAEFYFQSRPIYATSVKYYHQIYLSRVSHSHLGNMYISDITKTHIQEWQKMILRKHKISKSSINLYTKVLSAIANYAIKNDYHTGKNIFLLCKLPKSEVIRERFLTKGEISLLLSTVKPESTLYFFVLLALSTGARVQSILNIRKKDVNFSQSYVNIRDTKNSSTYKAFFAEELANLLKESCDSLDDPNSYILKEKTGINSKISVKLKKILDELFNKNLDRKDSVNRVVIHTFRHTFASHLAIQGVPIIKIQALLNHKNIQMTMRYAKLEPDAGKSEAIELARGFFAS
ncbi:tyrosine-type recombinase/integrase [Romboutsia sp.]|uniref:tyrosine-type recombinase/integrase n=1 Tax=Romboutsia sp. TaxID=1965302 RepID=UPI003F4058BA